LFVLFCFVLFVSSPERAENFMKMLNIFRFNDRNQMAKTRQYNTKQHKEEY
jgi:hypothetical protein